MLTLLVGCNINESVTTINVPQVKSVEQQYCQRLPNLDKANIIHRSFSSIIIINRDTGFQA